MTDDDLFRQQMQDVAPLKPATPRVERTARRRALDPERREARAHASAELAADDNPLADNFIPEVSPDDVLEFARPGVQHGVLKNMRLGKYAVDARLDLHRHTIEQARTAVFQFSQDCLRYSVRTALIVHGKGRDAKLKSCVNYWLRDLPDVLAFHTAQKQHGGAGAVYVLFRKSDAQKLATKEKHTRR